MRIGIATLTAERGIALLIITHDLGVAADRADRVLVLQRGRLVEEAAPQHLLLSPTAAYTRELIDAAPALGAGGELVARHRDVAPRDELLRIDDVTKHFPLPAGGQSRRTVALDGVSLTARRGQTLAIVGESGSGKTTLLRIALGLEQPTSGAVRFAGGARPAVLEILDEATLGAIDAAEGTVLRANGAALLVAQTDGFGAAAEMRAVRAAVDPLAVHAEWTTDPRETERLLAARRQAPPAIERRGRVLIEDIAVPRSRLVEAIRGIRDIAARTGAEIYVFGHAGDGNLHPIIVVGGPHGEGIPVHAQRAADEIFALALALGGTLTAEHGIGRLKRDWVGTELGPRVHDIQRALRSLLDPAGILNPGAAI